MPLCSHSRLAEWHLCSRDGHYEADCWRPPCAAKAIENTEFPGVYHILCNRSGCHDTTSTRSELANGRHAATTKSTVNVRETLLADCCHVPSTQWCSRYCGATHMLLCTMRSAETDLSPPPSKRFITRGNAINSRLMLHAFGPIARHARPI
jgi:hypothetical protein